jgi:hypothetical protein
VYLKVFIYVVIGEIKKFKSNSYCKEIIYVGLNFVPGGVGVFVGIVNSHQLDHGVMHSRLERVLVHKGDDASGELGGEHDEQQSSILGKYFLILVQFAIKNKEM